MLLLLVTLIMISSWFRLLIIYFYLLCFFPSPCPPTCSYNTSTCMIFLEHCVIPSKSQFLLILKYLCGFLCTENKNKSFSKCLVTWVIATVNPLSATTSSLGFKTLCIILYTTKQKKINHITFVIFTLAYSYTNFLILH